MSAYCPECRKNHSVNMNTHEQYMGRCTCGATCHSDCGCTVEVKCSDCKQRNREKNRESTASRKWRRRTENGRCSNRECFKFLSKNRYKKQLGTCLECWSKIPKNDRPPRIHDLIFMGCFDGH